MYIGRRCSGHEEKTLQMCLVLLVVCRSLPSDVALTDDDEEDEEEEDEVERWTTLLSLLPAELPTVE